MPPNEPSGPDLAGVVADADAVSLGYVVIGGFSVIFHGFIRATKDSDLLVPDGSDADAAVLRFLELCDAKRLRDGKILTADDVVEAEHLRITSRNGIVDIMRGGLPPLDYETVAQRAESVDWNGQTVRIAALPSVVGFKRLASRPQDKVDLAELEEIHGELPVEPIPGLDS
ncbi:MAG: hypothetical protein ACJ75S_06340 [Solirubrobacterales bacterium]